MRPGRLIAQCLLVALTCIYACAPTVGATDGEYLSYFNVPPEGRASDTLEQRLLTYIGHAAPNSEIRGNITSISKERITDALIKANRERGVRVYLVQNGEDVKCPRLTCPSRDPEVRTEGEKLEEHFGTRHKECYFDIAPTGPSDRDLTSCVSSVTNDSVDTTHHLKNWLFSKVVINGKVKHYSSWVMSYNLTLTSDRQFNDAFVVNGNKPLYDAFKRSFASFYNQDRSDDFYNVAGRGHHVVPSANAEISYSPQKTNDYVAKALSRIDGDAKPCWLRVANLSISSSRKRVIRRLADLKQRGCRVQVAFSEGRGKAVKQLLDANIELRQAVKTQIHSKTMLFAGRYDGRRRTMVWGGSHNLTIPSLQLRDEVFVGISHLGIYKSYRAYFRTIWGRSTPFVVVPDVRLHGREGARRRISAAGLMPAFTGALSPQSWVFSQAPRGGIHVLEGSTVTMHLRAGPIP